MMLAIMIIWIASFFVLVISSFADNAISLRVKAQFGAGAQGSFVHRVLSFYKNYPAAARNSKLGCAHRIANAGMFSGLAGIVFCAIAFCVAITH